MTGVWTAMSITQGDDRKTQTRAPLPLDVPYGERPWDDPLCLDALADCPWKDTDHDRGEGPRRENYCTWCDGHVTGAIRVLKAFKDALHATAEHYGMEAT